VNRRGHGSGVRGQGKIGMKSPQDNNEAGDIVPRQEKISTKLFLSGSQSRRRGECSMLLPDTAIWPVISATWAIRVTCGEIEACDIQAEKYRMPLNGSQPQDYRSRRFI